MTQNDVLDERRSLSSEDRGTMTESSSVRRRAATEELFFERAVHHARAAKDLERQGVPTSQSFVESAESIILAVAASEAYINQIILDLWEDPEEIQEKRVKPLASYTVAERIADFHKLKGKRNPLSTKWRFLKELLSGQEYSDAENPYRDFRNSVGIRNDLVHFEEPWDRGSFNSSNAWEPDVFKRITAATAADVVDAVGNIIQDFHSVVSREVPSTFLLRA